MRLSALTLSILITGPLHAEATLPAVDAEIAAMWTAQDARWGWDSAEATMRAALAGSDAGPWVTDQWGQWMALEFSHVDDVYEQARRSVAEWGYAVTRGDVAEAEAVAGLRAPLQALVAADARVTRGFAIYLAQMQARRGWMDRAGRLSPSTQCEAYYLALAMSQRHLDAAVAALPVELRRAALFPMPYEEAPGAGLDLSPLLPGPEAGLGEQARAYRTILTRLDAAGVAADDPFRGAIAQMAEQAEAQMTGAAGLLEAAGQAEGALRQDMLRSAEAAALDRMGSVLPQVIAARADAGPLTAADLRMVADFATRLRRFHDDAADPLAQPSGPYRALSALRAVATILEGAEAGREVESLQAIVRDTLTALTPHVPAHAAHAIPGAIVAAEVEIMAEAMERSAGVLDDIAAYIRTGDPEALERALHGSRQVQEILHPAGIARRLLEAEVEGLLANVPGLRAAMATFLDDLLALPPDAGLDTGHGYTCS